MSCPRVGFYASNYHVAGCGTPPTWVTHDSKNGERRFYCENDMGEQLVAGVSADLFRLINADVGWRSELRIEKPNYLDLVEKLEGPRASLFSGPPPFGGLIMNPYEKHWIRGVLLAPRAATTAKPASYRRRQSRSTTPY